MTDEIRRTIPLGDAIAADIAVSSQGVRLAGLRLPPHASVAVRRPGRLRGRWPSRTLDLSIDETGGEVYVRWELQIRPQDDASWQVSVHEQWGQDPDLSVTTPAGTVRISQVDEALDASAEQVTAGWGVRTQHEDRDACVTLTGDGEVWEVRAMVDDAGRWPFVIAREHRWVIDAV